MAFKTILLKGNGIRKEGIAIAAITPGDLIEVAPTGVQRAAQTIGNVVPAIALEYELAGKEIDDDYATDDQVIYEVLPPGAEFRGHMEASSAAVVIGDFLENAGDGTFRLATTSAATADTERNSLVAQALEAITPGVTKADNRITMQIT